MADQLQLRGGTTSEHATFTGALREVTVDTDKDTVVVHDNATVGGKPLMREDASNSALALGSAATPSLKWDANTGIYSPGANQLAVATNGTGRLFVDASGDVGVGTSSPNRKLEVSDAGADNFIRVNTTGATKSGIEFASGGLAYSQLYFTNVSPYDLSLQQQYTTGSLILGTNSTERARIDSSGRLLVGTSTASSAGTYAQYCPIKIQGNSSSSTGTGCLNIARGVAAASITSGSGIGTISFSDSSGNEFAWIACEADANAGASDYPGRLVFSTTPDSGSSPVERMRILSNGHMLLNTTSDLAHLTVVDSTYGASDIFIRTFGLSSNSFVVRGDGDCENTNNAYGAFSDIKLKENIVVASSQWNDIKALQVRNYNLKSNPSFAQIGLVAQEVETVSPGLVSELPDRDEDGNDLGTVTKSVKYSVLYMKAVKALQEAMERIETLEARLTAAGIE
jgi:hypothetical protein